MIIVVVVEFLFLRKRKHLNQLSSEGLSSQDVEDEVTAGICVVYLLKNSYE